MIEDHRLFAGLYILDQSAVSGIYLQLWASAANGCPFVGWFADRVGSPGCVVRKACTFMCAHCVSSSAAHVHIG